jgi:nicotinate-nucleotide adenylyltransferase
VRDGCTLERSVAPRTRPAKLPGPSRGLSIGLMGGSFDPPHSGHRHVAQAALTALDLDWVWVIPARGNPLKRTQTSFEQRLQGARAALAGPRIRISAIEHDLGLTYTIDLIRALKRRAPAARFVWIMGADNLPQMTRWKAWERVAAEIPIAVVSRPGANPRAGLSPFARRFASARRAPSAGRALVLLKPPAWIYLTAPFDPASSTALRAGLAVSASPPSSVGQPLAAAAGPAG